MMLTRRNFVRLGCVSATALASTYLLGCSSGSTAGLSGAASEDAPEVGSSLARKDEAAEVSKGKASSAAETSQGTEKASESEEAPETETAEPAEQFDETEPTDEEPASEEEDQVTIANEGSTAVVFFSCTGNTEAVAEKVAQAAGASLLRVLPAEPYTSADIDYNSDCRANREQDSVTDRPALDVSVPDVSGYDTIYLGYPIWWGKVPRVMLTFLKSVDLSGKTVIPFCTSGSSSISGSLDEVHSAASGASWQDGQRFDSGVSQQEIDSWVASF